MSGIIFFMLNKCGYSPSVLKFFVVCNVMAGEGLKLNFTTGNTLIKFHCVHGEKC